MRIKWFFMNCVSLLGMYIVDVYATWMSGIFHPKCDKCSIPLGNRVFNIYPFQLLILKNSPRYRIWFIFLAILLKVQNAKQVNSALKQKMEGGIEEFKPPEVCYWRVYVTMVKPCSLNYSVFNYYILVTCALWRFYYIDNLLCLYFVI